MKVAAFNAKRLGFKKASDPFVSDHLIKILSRYTIVVVLEVVDQSDKAKDLLLEKLQEENENYDMIYSPALGRNKYKEQVVVFFRSDEVTHKDDYQYNDNQPGDEDTFARDPFNIRFHCPDAVVQDLALIAVHTKPDDSRKELDELYDVVMDVRKTWSRCKILLLGDFNAAGPYLSKKKQKSLRITSGHFHWLIDDSVDTTASNRNNHTYDRIVAYGPALQKAVVPGSATSFDFQEELALTDEEALSISDHYPVEVELQDKNEEVFDLASFAPLSCTLLTPTSMNNVNARFHPYSDEGRYRAWRQPFGYPKPICTLRPIQLNPDHTVRYRFVPKDISKLIRTGGISGAESQQNVAASNSLWF